MDAPESLAADVARALDELGIPFTLVGAAALAVRGVTRGSHDIDFMTTEVDDLVLLKIDAGSYLDQRDAAQLIAIHGSGVIDAVTARVTTLPAPLQDAWRLMRPRSCSISRSNSLRESDLVSSRATAADNDWYSLSSRSSSLRLSARSQEPGFRSEEPGFRIQGSGAKNSSF